jgi:hypothetical protein
MARCERVIGYLDDVSQRLSAFGQTNGLARRAPRSVASPRWGDPGLGALTAGVRGPGNIGGTCATEMAKHSEADETVDAQDR